MHDILSYTHTKRQERHNPTIWSLIFIIHRRTRTHYLIIFTTKKEQKPDPYLMYI